VSNTVINPNKPKDKMDIDIFLIISLIKKWWKLILTITVLVTLASAVITIYYIKPVYQASTLLMVTVASEKLQVSNQQINRNDSGNNTAPMPVLTMNTYLGQLESEVVMKRVVENTDIPGLSIGGLLAAVDASTVKDSNLILVKVRNTDAVKAANIANAVAEQYLKLMDELMFSSVVVISPANVPVSPIKPNKVFNIEIAFILGLMIAILLAFLLEFLDNTIKTVDDINQVLGLPVLAVIPIQTEQNTRQFQGGQI
jgi:capsular polysaccharide biosynthesis protein